MGKRTGRFSAFLVFCNRLTNDASKIALQLENLRLEGVPEHGGGGGGSGQTEGDDGQIAGDAVTIHAGVEPSEVDEDGDVDHVETVADAAVKGQRTLAEGSIDWVMRSG